MPSSTPRLSEVARHVVYPSGIVKTGYPAVKQKLADLGITFDAWQDGAATVALGKRADGLYAATVGGVFISIPRQVGKTFMLAAIIFALCLLHPNLTVIWTAHRVKTAGETFRSMQAMTRLKRIAPHVAKVVLGSGDEAIEFLNGSRILFGSRERGFGRGFPEVDVLVFDECQILTDATLDDMIPATNQSRQESGALVFYTGTPPTPKDAGEVFTSRRREALSGESDDLVYIEFSGDPETDPARWRQIDWEQVAKANPSFPKRTPRHAIQRMFKNLGPASFRREGLGIWDAGAGERAVISAPAWAELEGVPLEGTPYFGVRYDETGPALAVATCDGESVFVEVIAPPVDGWSTDSLASALVQADPKAVVVDGKAGASVLVAELRKRGIRGARVVQPTVDQAIAAHAGFLDLVTTQKLTHAPQAAVSREVAQAGKRKIGNLGGWGWAPFGDGTTTMLTAQTLAAWLAKTRTDRTKTHDDGRRRRGFSSGGEQL